MVNIKLENQFLDSEMSIKKSIVILAGGLGSRYNGLKQIDGILENNDSPILEYSIYDGIKAGFKKFVFIINDAIPQSYVDRLSAILEKENVEYHWVVQKLSDFVDHKELLETRQKPWGTGQAVLCTESVVNENFLVLNADDFYGRGSIEKAAQILDSGNQIDESHYTLVSYPLKNTLSKNGSVSRGLIGYDSNNLMISVKELTKIQPTENGIMYEEDGQQHPLGENDLVSMNFWIFNPSVFKYLKEGFTEFLNNDPAIKAEFFLPTLVGDLVNDKIVEVKVEKSDEIWKGVTYAEDKYEVQEFLIEKVNSEIYPEQLWNSNK